MLETENDASGSVTMFCENDVGDLQCSRKLSGSRSVEVTESSRSQPGCDDLKRLEIEFLAFLIRCSLPSFRGVTRSVIKAGFPGCSTRSQRNRRDIFCWASTLGFKDTRASHLVPMTRPRKIVTARGTPKDGCHSSSTGVAFVR